MVKLFQKVSCLSLCIASIASASQQNSDESITKYRVFVADHQLAKVTAFDLNTPETRWSFDLAGQAKLYPTNSGATVIAVQSDSDQVNFISSGILKESHGDHSDIEVSPPNLLQHVLNGPRPFHVVKHDQKTSINFDKGGYATVIDNVSFTHGSLTSINVPQNAAHHGVVVPWNDQWISSIAGEAEDPDKAPPRIGINTLNQEGEPQGELQTCNHLHGEAFSGAYLAFGCEEGVLTVKRNESGFAYRMLPYPSDAPEGSKTGTLLGSSSFQVFLGNFNADGLVVIDPEEAPHMRTIALPFKRVDFTLDPVQVTKAYVLTENGQIHRVDLLDAKIEQSRRVVAPYSMEGHWNDPRPRLAVAGDELLITDPKAGVIKRINTHDLSDIGKIQIDGQPYNITVVGGSGLTH